MPKDARTHGNIQQHTHEHTKVKTYIAAAAADHGRMKTNMNVAAVADLEEHTHKSKNVSHLETTSKMKGREHQPACRRRSRLASQDGSVYSTLFNPQSGTLYCQDSKTATSTFLKLWSLFKYFSVKDHKLFFSTWVISYLSNKKWISYEFSKSCATTYEV